MTHASIAIVAAVASNGVIGRAGGLPWRLSTDLTRFRRLTVGKPVIMGRKTFATIGRPLADRTNIVVTRDPGFAADGVRVAADLPSALDLARVDARRLGADEVFVIGGGEIYVEAIAMADRLYITHVDASPDGDTRFPPIDPAIWRAVSTEQFAAGEKDSAATIFVVYERRNG